SMISPPRSPTLFPYTTLFRSCCSTKMSATCCAFISVHVSQRDRNHFVGRGDTGQNFAHTVFAQRAHAQRARALPQHQGRAPVVRSEEHTSELQSLRHLVCRLL